MTKIKEKNELTLTFYNEIRYFLSIEDTNSRACYLLKIKNYETLNKNLCFY